MDDLTDDLIDYNKQQIHERNMLSYILKEKVVDNDETNIYGIFDPKYKV